MSVGFRFRLHPRSAEPLYRQIERQLREAIRAGALRSGERIPSVTDLARKLRVNRATIVSAFEELERAGLIESYVGRGTFVTEAAAAVPASEAARAPRRFRDNAAMGLRELLAIERPPGTIDLAAGVPDPVTIPDGTLEGLIAGALKKNPRRLLEYGGPAGLPELREVIAERLRREKLDVTPDQILITNGSQQAISLVGCWALEEGRDALCETPTFTGVPGAFLLLGLKVQSVPWQASALSLADLSARRAVLYCCPDHHNPTGQTLSTAARQEIVHFAERQDGVVLVDEIFRDLRFRGEAPPSLYGMLPPGRRILVGSISKSFMTGLRIGYLVADRPLIAQLLSYRRYLDLGGPAITQALAAGFLAQGYDRHLERVRGYYRERAEAAVAAFDRELPKGATFTRPDGGFLMWVTLRPGVSAIQLYLTALERGVAVSPGPAHDIEGGYTSSFRVSYGHATPAQIKMAIGRLGAIIQELSRAPDKAELGISL